MDGSGSVEAALSDPVKTSSDSHLSGRSSGSDSDDDGSTSEEEGSTSDEAGSTSGSSDPDSSTDDGTDSDSSGSSDTDSDCEGAEHRTCSINEADTNRPTGVAPTQQSPQQDAARPRRAQAAPRISPGALQLLQAPLPPGMPRFVRCHCTFVLRALYLPSQLSNQLTRLASGTDVKLLVTVHNDDWSPEQYLLSRPPSSSHSPQAGQTQAAAAAGSSSSTTLGPFVVEAKLGQGGRTRLHAEVHQALLGKYTGSREPHVVVLCEQVSRGCSC